MLDAEQLSMYIITCLYSYVCMCLPYMGRKGVTLMPLLSGDAWAQPFLGAAGSMNDCGHPTYTHTHTHTHRSDLLIIHI